MVLTLFNMTKIDWHKLFYLPVPLLTLSTFYPHYPSPIPADALPPVCRLLNLTGEVRQMSELPEVLRAPPAGVGRSGPVGSTRL